MSNEVEFVEATAIPRDEAELEGTLLPSSETVPLVTAAPISNFEYTEIAIVEDRQRLQQEEQAAFPIHQQSNTAMADDSRGRVKHAERSGVIESEQERFAIRNGNRRVFSQDYHTRNAIKEANRIAQAKDHVERQGRTPFMSEQAAPSSEAAVSEIPSSKPAEPAPTAAGYQMGGYKVKEYSMGSYQPNDYNISEYKSVYDN
jgi:hypothetical protein